MAATAFAALWVAVALLGEARYALSPGRPAEVGELASLRPQAELRRRRIPGRALAGRISGRR